jgi:hypothetical protein
MKNTITNERKTKAVNIITDNTGNVRAFYVQFTTTGEQVLQAKDFSSAKNASRWAIKMLN